MGKVFTPAEVRQGHVPELASFASLAAEYRAWLPGERWFAGGILAGSVLQNKHNLRSDIDLFIAFEGPEHVATAALRAFWKRNARKTHVPVNINLWSVRNLKEGAHTIGFGFLGHLRWASENGGLIGENPLRSIVLAPRHRAKEDLRSYLAKKIKRMRESSCEGGLWTDVRCHTLEGVAAASLHASRRWLALKGHSEDDFRSKDDVMQRMEARSSLLGGELRALVEADAEYARALNQLITGESSDRKAYIRALETLSAHTGSASVFLGRLYS